MLRNVNEKDRKGLFFFLVFLDNKNLIKSSRDPVLVWTRIKAGNKFSILAKEFFSVGLVFKIQKNFTELSLRKTNIKKEHQ